jgi:S-adenosylmethionine:tRNA ribosyltransferase-isomerase
MLISDFDFALPDELIAQEPLARRDASRMLAVDGAAGAWRDEAFTDFPTHLRAGDVMVLNNTKVFPARLAGRREPTGGRVEVFLIRELEPLVWETLARPGRRLMPGQRINFGGGRLRGEVLAAAPDGRRTVRFSGDEPFAALVDELGRTPLPPYIKRDADGSDADRERYQTVYARQRGAIAAPTAGLHFTPQILQQVKERGARVVEITLHVGYGTFEPVRAADVAQHRVAAESYEITPEAAEIINETRAGDGRLLAVGTTTTRALESAADDAGRIRAGAGQAALTITPGYRFRAVDALLTNFHLPQSSLLLLVSAFAGREFVLAAYAHAVAARYRFYSYGDCMLLTGAGQNY